MQQKDNCKVEFLFKYDRNLSFIDLLVDQNLSVVRYGYLKSKGFLITHIAQLLLYCIYNQHLSKVDHGEESGTVSERL